MRKEHVNLCHTVSVCTCKCVCLCVPCGWIFISIKAIHLWVCHLLAPSGIIGQKQSINCVFLGLFVDKEVQNLKPRNIVINSETNLCQMSIILLLIV